MPTPPDVTVSADELTAGDLFAGTPVLVRAFEADLPLEPPSRLALGDVDLVTIGRGERALVRRGRELQVHIPDAKMSGTHARIARTAAGFLLEDAGSKNGTLLNGETCASAELKNGDVIEVGHTFFVYRSRSRVGAAETQTVVAPGDDATAVPLATLQPELAKQFEILEQLAGSDLPIIILGETGTGKEVVARALHRMSRRQGPFTAVNCGAIPATLIESELFGSKKGAFSGAVEDRVGLVRSAHGGTLFLDEIGELPPPAQVALLRVLQEREVVPVGTTKPIKVDVRVVTATHRELDKLVDAGDFRADLYGRLAGYTVRLPALRERREDLGLVVASLLRRLTPKPETVRFSRHAARALFLHAFPLNVRELEKALTFALALAQDATITSEKLPETLQHARYTPPQTSPNEEEERKEQLLALLREHKGRVAQVAEAMGKHRMQVHRWIEKYGIDLEAFRKR